MGSLKTDVIFKATLRTIIYALFGFFVFFLTSFFLYKKNYTKGSFHYSTIGEADSCILEYPDYLFKTGNGVILMYIETKACAKCSESIILNTVNSLKDSKLIVEPVLLFHPSEKTDSVKINDYYDIFAEHVKTVVTYDDSIMINNSWLPDNFGFYGIVTDSLNMVQYAGSLFDPGFLACCKRQFGKRESERE